jgi:TonB-dependent SusC/RagA subfamily outer membrane receptor
MPRMPLALPPRRRVVLCAALALGAACVHGRRDTGPATSPVVTAEDIERNPGTPIEQIIEAKIPGIQVTRTGNGGIAIRIRGTSSFYSSNEPLYVLDGVPLESGPGGALTGLNPYDIQSIRVLKDPADTGIYGVRGANGVVVVTTKQPGHRDRPPST